MKARTERAKAARAAEAKAVDGDAKAQIETDNEAARIVEEQKAEEAKVAKANAVGQLKSKTFTVANNFLSPDGKVWEKGADVSNFDTGRLAGLVDRGLVKQG